LFNCGGWGGGWGWGAGAWGGAGALYVSDRDAFGAAVRWGRCLRTVAVIVVDYKWALRNLQGEARAAALAAAHHRNAVRLRALFFRNRGLYLKVGQHLGMMDYVVPDPYVLAMRSCYDDAPRSTFEDVAAVIQDDFGTPLGELFAEFEATPLASASLAQVHAARLPDGRRVAVKVQHRGLRRMAAAEISAVAQLMRWVRWLQPDFGFQWLVEEMQFNIPRELDFRMEADNADVCRGLCRPFGDRVVVPAVHRAFSSESVLTMDFEPGCALTDAATIRDFGLQPRAVVRLLAEVFGEMVFCRGHVHCDPHPGNVLIRRRPGGGPQLVLLDHGLYRRVPRDLRLQYCELWKSIVLGDERGIQHAARAMGIRSPWMETKFPGAEVSHRMIAAMLTGREWPDIAASGRLDRFDAGPPAEVYQQQLSANVAEYLGGILDVLESCPRDLLLLMKTNDALRSAAGRLGGRGVDTFIVTAKCCLRALWREPATGSLAERVTERTSLAWAFCRCQAFQWLTDLRVL